MDKDDLKTYSDDQLFDEWDHQMSLFHQHQDLTAWARCVAIEAEVDRRELSGDSKQ